MKENISSFENDIHGAQIVASYMDKNFWGCWGYTRTEDRYFQKMGVDLVSRGIFIDEKCDIQLRKVISTYLMELGYAKNGVFVEGWFTKHGSLTEYYALLYVLSDTEIRKESDIKVVYMIWVSKADVIRYFKNLNWTQDDLFKEARGMWEKQEARRYFVGFHMTCTLWKKEQPVNAIISEEEYEKMPSCLLFEIRPNGNVRQLETLQNIIWKN